MAAYTTIDDAGSFCNPVIYTGNGTAYGSGGNAITGVGFQPDFTWIKSRTTAEEHVLTDAVRGVTKIIRTTGTYAESTAVEGLNVFGSDGFTIGSSDQFNTNTEDYVSWNWKAGTTTGIAGSPSVTPSSYTFNQTSGFSAIAFTGNGVAGMTIPHGLGVAPDMVTVKRLDSTSDWAVYHSGIDTTAPEDYQMVLNTTAARSDDVGGWNDTAPTSTLVSLGANNNTNTATFIAYCFAAVKGYSKFSSYTGNGNADGPFVYTGFKPAFVMIKRRDTTGAWQIWDNKRPPYNATTGRLYPNGADVESNTQQLDILSNGFKYRNTGAAANASGGIYLYAVFAASPLVNSEGVPTNAH